MVMTEEIESGKKSATDPGSNVAQRVRKQSSLFQLAHIGIYSSVYMHCYFFPVYARFFLLYFCVYVGGVFNGQNGRRTGAVEKRTGESPE